MIILMNIFLACNFNGVKGDWASELESEFMKSCVAERGEIFTKEQMTKLCSCSMNKIEAEYAPEDLTKPEAIKFSEKAGASCALDVLNVK